MLIQMVQQTIDSKFSEYGMGSTENDLPTRDKQLSVAVKKTALRDLQNDNRIMMPNSTENSPLLKDRNPISDALEVSGAKKPSLECPESPPQYQSPSSNAANGHLVYVRRKSEAELGKSSTGDSSSINAECLQSRKLNHQEETTRPKSQMEPKVSCFPAFAPLPMVASMSSSGKPSVPCNLGKPGMALAPVEPNNHHVASAAPLLSNPKGSWEERYHQLKMFLRKLDEADQEEYLQMLRSFSPVELSRYAVEVEKRSIQLSLEEAKELQRVTALNVLGKCIMDFKAASTHQDRLEK
ncbi:uncharacterized protein LOC108997388 isoform X1 [Juglans regia]|nr:uncharacterized protein LOC108997388 isoform X1 [Juglans regia]XP_018829175.1 uncharacterized protein LOC108997388 isoform X1 [Juglans regia]XP_035540599.1 uncharacterized protein LOC108997388 isoform X1 [Juglans regia]XP_035540600.1 uncharacterized protein LOC108997388 isoform X1 [Juglans regia]XP_035540603.1 uncharacterized protein LOC108997388 isoform X1 [Juglans regia]